MTAALAQDQVPLVAEVPVEVAPVEGEDGPLLIDDLRQHDAAPPTETVKQLADAGLIEAQRGIADGGVIVEMSEGEKAFVFGLFVVLGEVIKHRLVDILFRE